MKIRCAYVLSLIVAADIAQFGSSANAQTNKVERAYPAKPIRLIVPFPSGGATDLIVRSVTEKLPLHLGQNVVVDNRGAAAGVPATELLAKATADGYTLGVATASTMATGPAIDPKVPYSPTADFTMIMNIAATPNVLVVHPSFPSRDFNAFMAEVRGRPGYFNYASSGIGGLGHMLMMLFQSKTGTSLAHIPYKGGNDAVRDVVGGHIPLMIANITTVLAHIKANPQRLVPIAVAARKNVEDMPSVPTFEQLRLPDVNRLAFYGICGPKGLSRQIVSRVHTAVKQTLSDPKVINAITTTHGSVIIGNSPEQFREEIRVEFEIYKKLVQSQKLKL
jgi:tripartite-type tricarboxylate transporter receptor subunit TctC